jgi:hypothetical protein
MRTVAPAYFLAAALLPSLLAANPAHAETRVAPTASGGFFFEFGDEAGFSGGFALWLGASLYPDVRPSKAQTTGFAALGVELRTGPIPLLTGPNQFIPQLRGGIVSLGGEDFIEDDSEFKNLTFPKYKAYGSVGYRWASSFGLDNLDGRRKDEQAFRFGVGLQSLAYLKAIDPVPSPDGLELMLDVNHDGSLDRYGFDVNLGF